MATENPETPQTPAPEAPAQPPAPEGPTNEELMAAIRERDLRLQMEQEGRLRAEAAAREAWTRHPQQPEVPAADPLENLGADLLANPQAATAKLKGYLAEEVNRRSREEAARIAQANQAAWQQQQGMMQAQMALTSAAAKYPELNDPNNRARLAGAITQANFEAQAQGLNLPQEQLLDRAARIMRGQTQAQRPQTPPPHVEGSGSPAYANVPGVNPVAAAPERSKIEEWYEMPAGFIKDIPSPHEVEGLTAKWVEDENAMKVKNGIMNPYSPLQAK